MHACFSRKDPATNSLPPERARNASDAPVENPASPRPLLRRDLRRSATAEPQPPRTASIPEAATTPRVQAEPQPEPQPEPHPAEPQPEPHPAEPQPAESQPQPQTPPQPERGRASRPRVRLPRTPSRAAQPQRPWAKAKALGATFAVGALITGAALPAIEPAVAQDDTARVAVSADGIAQSYTANDGIRVDIAPRGSFSATTPEEIKQTRSRAAAAAVAAGMPLGSAIDIPVADRIVMPMADGSYSFSDGFGASRPGRSHLGQDFAAGVGTPINAAMKGCVSRSTESYQGYGVTIQIESIVDGQAVSTVYSHMTYGSRAVEVGDCVEAGQYIGDVGSTGYVFGSCLHFEVHINTVPVDPMPWLQKNVS